jgi:hypothetical protein
MDFRYSLILAVLLSTTAMSLSSGEQFEPTELGCVEDPEISPTSLAMTPTFSARVRGFSCPLALGGSYLRYAIEWRGARLERHEYSDPKHTPSDGIVGVSITRVSPSLILIDEQQERGGDAILVWRAGQSQFHSRRFAYRGSDEGNLQVRQTGNVVRAVFIERRGAVTRPVGAPIVFRLSRSGGIAG